MPENRPKSPSPPPRLLDRLRDAIRARHYSPRTVEAYVFWTRRFVVFHGKRHPDVMGSAEVQTFITDLAITHKVAASTQNQALAALVFLYRHVLGKELEGFKDLIRAKRPKRVPIALSPAEIASILRHQRGVAQLATLLMYGSGLRLLECLQLRVGDLNFESREIVVRQGKGQKDRRTLLPAFALDPLKQHLSRLREQHASDLGIGLCGAFLPDDVEKQRPTASIEWSWQWIFPASRAIRITGGPRKRHHLHETAIQRSFASAVIRAGILKKATCHSLRHSFATQLVEASYDIRTIQELMGHKDVGTTLIYTHVANRGRGVRSPFDDLPRATVKVEPSWPFRN